ncbi:hypothetical protein LIER_33716 [Lithospermum erythrorhizon]|uniref:3'-5' exonuclease domain-containing protein n=1 Tax=Lithospermum erythrorhizon TaxID=34254 RepID=A0AAV3RZ82_LITER
MMSLNHPSTVHWVSSTTSPEFTHLSYALTHSTVIALDAEWKPVLKNNPSHIEYVKSTPTIDTKTKKHTFPIVSLLQIACFSSTNDQNISSSNESLVFLLDLSTINLLSVYGLLKEVFISPYVIKLGFKFKQDLIYLSSTFSVSGCNNGFDKIEPYLDITSIYYHLYLKQSRSKAPKQNKSLATICKEVLGISLSKELQCSDWSQRPLTVEQLTYAAKDAYCLLEIFSVFVAMVEKEGDSPSDDGNVWSSNLDCGLKHIFEMPSYGEKFVVTKYGEASDIIRATLSESIQEMSTEDISDSLKSSSITNELDRLLLNIARKYGDKIVLKESDKTPKMSKKKVKKNSTTTMIAKDRHFEDVDNWQSTPPWDLSMGGDGCPKFLCDVMVEGLAKQLRCVGIDAAIPYSRKPETRELIDQSCKENRVLLTRDAKIMRHGYLFRNQIYRVKSLLKNEQLLEIIETFQLEISEDRLMSRCTKCNGIFIHKPLSSEEAVEAAKGFQVIPNCLFNKNLEFWQCMDCHQLYWEGTQYHNAVQKFIDICKLDK